MPRPKKYYMVSTGLNTRVADRDDCELYLECLTEASHKMLKCLPCEGCSRYKRAVVERDYEQRRYVDNW